jgi:hypothetical protein
MNLAQASAAAMLAAVAALCNGGTLTIYSGTMPASPETALSGNTALVRFTFSSPAFGSASYASGNESVGASFVSSNVAPLATGTATFARILKSDGTTVVMDLTVGTGSTDVVVGSTSIVTGTNVNILSLTFAQAAV